MKFKLKNNPINTDSLNPLEDYLKNLGIKNVSSFINGPEEADEESWKLISYMRQGVEMLHKHISQNSKIFLQVDSDADGYTSAAIIYMFLKQVNPSLDIHFNIHPAKEHGIILEDIKEDYDLIIVPDAGSNQRELKTLSDKSDILIIDHHIADVDINSDKIIVVNNQTSPLFDNSSLSGAGMVYKTIQAYSEKYLRNEEYKKYMDLAAIGIVADSMDSRTLDNNYLIQNGLNNIENDMIKALLKAREFSVSSITSPNKIDIAFYVAPIINGLIRSGTMEEKRNFFYALVTPGVTETFERESRGVTVTETFYQVEARKAISAKTRQDAGVNKILPILKDRIEDAGLDRNQIIICKTSKSNPDEVPKTVTGLVAMKLSAYYSRPVLVLRPVFKGNEVLFAGSGRASTADGFNGFKEFLDSSGYVTFAAGHSMAFGTGVKEEYIPLLEDYANDALSHVDFGSSTVEVDAHLTSVDPQLVKSFGEVNHLYGNRIPEPLFMFDLLLTQSDFQTIGANKQTLKIARHGLEFIKFRSASEIEKLMAGKGMMKVRLVGKPAINSFRGKVTPQIKVEYLEILEEEVSLF